MRKVRLSSVLLAVVLPMAGSAHGQDGAKEPVELVRSLRVLQDQMALGNSSALDAQRALLGRVGEQLARVDKAKWAEPANARAAVTFVLSGGDPRLLRRMIDSQVRPGIDERLLRGALAYGEGRNAEASDLLGPIDARSLDRSIAGHIALVQSELIAKKDPRKALAYLDDARLLSPGTLVEEAALRRQVSLVAASGDFNRFEGLSLQYLRRFPNSVYVAAFRRQFATELAGVQGNEDPASLSRLEVALTTLASTDRREVYLSIAKEGIVRGRVEMTRFAVRNASPLMEEGSADTARCRVYEGAALVVTDEYHKGLSALESVERAKLGQQDADLLDAANAVGRQVRRMPELSDLSIEPPFPASRMGRADLADVLQVADLARKAIGQVDDMIKGAGK